MNYGGEMQSSWLLLFELYEWLCDAYRSYHNVDGRWGRAVGRRL